MSEFASFLRWVAGDVVTSTPRRQLVIVAGSAKGCGTTTITTMLARAAAAEGAEALVIDACGGASAARSGPPDTAEMPQLFVLREGVTVARAATQPRLRRMLPVIPRYDVAFVDVGSRSSTLRDVLSALSDGVRGSDQLLVVSRTAPAHCAAAYALIKGIGARPLAPRLHLLANEADGESAASAYERVEAATRRFCRRSVTYAGAFPADPLLHADASSELAHAPFGELHTDATASDLFRRLLRPVPNRSHAPNAGRLLPRETR